MSSSISIVSLVQVSSCSNTGSISSSFLLLSKTVYSIYVS